MPTCQNCSEHFPNLKEIDGKTRHLHRRKFCLSCSPFGSGNTSSIPPILKHTRPRNFKRKNAHHFICNICNKNVFQTGTGLICGTCKSRKIRSKRKAKSRLLLGNKCCRCGYSGAALVFHHFNKDNKSFILSTGWSKKWSVILKELEKCILLCANCHTEEHSTGT